MPVPHAPQRHRRKRPRLRDKNAAKAITLCAATLIGVVTTFRVGGPGGGALIALGVVELGRAGLKRLPDRLAIPLLGRVLPIATALLATAATYSFLYALQVSPRALARQVGLPDTELSGLLALATATYAGYLLLAALPQLHRRVQSWFDAARSARLRAMCLYLSCLGLIGVAFAPNPQLLRAAVVAATAGGLGGVILKCEVVRAAQSHGLLNSADVSTTVAFLVGIGFIPIGFGLLAKEGQPAIAGLERHSWGFVALGGAIFLAARWIPPLLRMGTAVPRHDEGPGLRDRLLWRAIVLTALSFAAIGPPDAALVYILGDQGPAWIARNAELVTAILLLAGGAVGFFVDRIKRLMQTRLWAIAVLATGLGLLAAVAGLAVSGWHGWGWFAVAGGAYVVLEPSTSVGFLVAELIALRDPANWERSALVSGIRLLLKALAAASFAIGGAVVGWQVSVLIGVLALAVALPPWPEMGRAPLRRFKVTVGRARALVITHGWPGTGPVLIFAGDSTTSKGRLAADVEYAARQGRPALAIMPLRGRIGTRRRQPPLDEAARALASVIKELTTVVVTYQPPALQEIPTIPGQPAKEPR